MTLACLTASRSPPPASLSCGQVTDELIWMLAPFSLLFELALQPVLLPDALTALASWVIV